MSQNIRNQFWILLAAATIFLTCLGTAGLWDEDETWYATCAREMMQRGDWVVPMFNGRMFPEKPPLMFWTMMAGFEIFGTNELGARFFSAIFGIATALLTYHLGRKLFGDRVGFWGALITASTIIFTVSARAATVDAALVFLTTAAVWCFVIIKGVKSGERTTESKAYRKALVSTPQCGNENNVARFALANLQWIICNNSLRQFLLFIAFYVFLGLAVLAKGPIGFLLPMTALGLFLMIENYRPSQSVASRWKYFDTAKRILASFFASLWQLRPVTGLIVTLTVAMPWYAMVAARTQGTWIQTFIVDFCIRPFTQPILGHSGPFWYYLPAVLIGFFPWSVFLGPTCVDFVRRFRANDPRREGLLLLACLFGSWFVFWSICSTKLPHYLLPVYPALSLLTAVFLDGWISDPARVGRGWMKAAWLSTIVVGVGMAVALPIVAYLLLPGEEWIGAIGLIPILGGALGLHFTARNKPLQAVRSYGIASIALLTAMFGFVAIGIDRHQNARPLLAEIRRDSSAPASICEYRFNRKGPVFYAGHPISLCETPDDLKKYLDSKNQKYIITLDKYEAEIEKNHPGEFEEFCRQRRFLAFDELVVMKHVPGTRTARINSERDSKQ